MADRLRIALLEPYYTGSHERWAKDLIKYSRHSIQLFSLPGRFWKWRMEASAIELANQLNDSTESYDILLCSDMMDLSLFKSLLHSEHSGTPIIYYLHENQLNYPRSSMDREYERSEAHYGFINYKSCLVADYCAFNSQWHLSHFIGALESLFVKLPDYQPFDSISSIQNKSAILPIPMPISELESIEKDPTLQSDIPVLLWNHRWEYDKQPEVFIELCDKLSESHKSFKINFLGQHHKSSTQAIDNFKSRHADRILHFGYVHNYVKYVQIMKASHILPVTAIHDFFGISVMEAIACDVIPVLPRGMVYEDHYKQLPESCFHSDFQSLYDNTVLHMEAIKKASSSDSLSQDLSSYDVQSILSQYDSYFEDIKKER